MSSEWHSMRLGDCCEKIGSGATPKGGKDAYLDSGPVRLIRSQNIYNEGFSPSGLAFINDDQAKKLDSASVLPGDVLLNITGDSVARVCQASVAYLPARVNQHVAIIRPNQKIYDAKYLRYFLASPAQQQLMLGLAAAGATRNALTKGMIEAFQVPCPPLEVQLGIADVLGALDDRITLLRETNATLEAIAQALFKSWFVDFDPVRAKMEGRAPEGMDEATAALFPDALEETELGPVPRGWRYSTIGESFILTMGQSPPGDTYNEAGDGLPFYQGRTDFGFRFPSQRVFCTAPTRLAEPGDTLVSVRAPVGDVNMALEKCCVGRGVAAVRHPNGCRSFAFYATRGLRSRFDLFDSEGTVFGSINKKDFQALPVIEPSGDVLVAFDEIAAPIDRRIVGNEEQIRTLATLRDTLLPRLISGQLRVPEATLA